MPNKVYNGKRHTKNSTSKEKTPRMKWNKLYKDKYSDIISESIKSIGVDLNSACAVDLAARKMNGILEYAATQAAQKGNKLKRPTSKLEVWTPEIQAAVRTK